MGGDYAGPVVRCGGGRLLGFAEAGGIAKDASPANAILAADGWEAICRECRVGLSLDVAGLVRLGLIAGTSSILCARSVDMGITHRRVAEIAEN